MSGNLNDIRRRIKKAGRENIKVIPEDNNNPFGRQLVQLYESGNWYVVWNSVNKVQAENLVAESINRVILG